MKRIKAKGIGDRYDRMNTEDFFNSRVVTYWSNSARVRSDIANRRLPARPMWPTDLHTDLLALD